MELTAVIQGVEVQKEPCVVELYSDSKYVIDALEKGGHCVGKNVDGLRAIRSRR